MTSPRRHADWYFDILSPFAYLQLKAHMRGCARRRRSRRSRLCSARCCRTGARRARPRSSRSACTPTAWRSTGRLSSGCRSGFRRRTRSTRSASRAIVAAGTSWAAVDAMFDLVWAQGLDLSGPAGLEAMAAALDAPDLAARIGTDQVKTELRANGEAALAADVFGVPTFVMDGQAFWGEDATSLFAAFVADPDLFREPEMARLETIPVGVSRK